MASFSLGKRNRDLPIISNIDFVSIFSPKEKSIQIRTKPFSWIASCLAYELRLRGINVKTQQPLPVFYKDVMLDCGYRLDLLVEDEVIVEVKSVRELAAIHEAQLLSYLRLSNCKTGLLINFNVKMLKNGIKRLVI